MEPIIRFEKLRVVYEAGKANEFTALHDISGEIYPQEYIIFFGPSGCGKSTMLYTILGLQTPTEGRVFLKGRDRTTFSQQEKRDIFRHFFGIVFQKFNLIFSLNVIENVALPQAWINAGQSVRKKRALELLGRFGIANRADNKPATLSGGQQQRVAICRALINDPDVILADEPVGNLDSESARLVMKTLSEINTRDKKTVVLVTHDARYLHYADRVFYFEDGRITRVVKNEHKTDADINTNIEEAQAEAERAGTTGEDLHRLAGQADNEHEAALKAWSLANYMANALTANQMERLEQAVEKILTDVMTPNDFFEFLNLAYNQGGVGLHQATAVKYSLEIQKIIDAAKLVTAAQAVEPPPQPTTPPPPALPAVSHPPLPPTAGPHASQFAIKQLRDVLLEEKKGKMSLEQVNRLETAISERLNGKKSSRQFSRFLDQPIDDGGVGLNVMTAEHLTEKLDILLAEKK